MQKLNEPRDGQTKTVELTSSLLFLALNNFEEFEREVLGHKQDRAAMPHTTKNLPGLPKFAKHLE
ncbi:MAG TPA: hypothetical protein VFA65_23645 [Bryobacteraceae bacterium]|nr:hypothetical protein [Bryobacteraceae bacterium]